MLILGLLFILVQAVNAQQPVSNMPAFFQEYELKPDNKLTRYKKYDFAPLWTQTENRYVYGIIGKDNQRIKIKFTSITRNPNNSTEYLVIGKSAVKNNICAFQGTIRVREIREVKQLHYGVDDAYKNRGILAQGILVADYEFFETKGQPHSGVFRGKLYTAWYLDKAHNLKYNDIQSQSDGYLNNAFVGNWSMYDADLVQVCNWADHRVPNPAAGFDMGAGEFSPADKYLAKGWESYRRAMDGDRLAIALESAAWWE